MTDQLTQSYELLNLSADWRGVMGSDFDLGVYANNALDKEYPLGYLNLLTSLGFAASTPGEPLTVGVRATYRFGRWEQPSARQQPPLLPSEALPPAGSPAPRAAPLRAPARGRMRRPPPRRGLTRSGDGGAPVWRRVARRSGRAMHRGVA